MHYTQSFPNLTILNNNKQNTHFIFLLFLSGDERESPPRNPGNALECVDREPVVLLLHAPHPPEIVLVWHPPADAG